VLPAMFVGFNNSSNVVSESFALFSKPKPVGPLHKLVNAAFSQRKSQFGVPLNAPAASTPKRRVLEVHLGFSRDVFMTVELRAIEASCRLLMVHLREHELRSGRCSGELASVAKQVDDQQPHPLNVRRLHQYPRSTKLIP